MAEDLASVQTLHKKQGLNYEAPDWSGLPVGGVVDIDGKVEMAIFLRKTAEAFFLLDPESGDRKRDTLGKFIALHNEMIQPALRAGFRDVHCWVPPQMELYFGALLKNERLGWAKQLWPCYSRELK